MFRLVILLFVAGLELCANPELLFAQQSTSNSAAKHSSIGKAALETGSLADGVYRNSYFHFSYRQPYGWVDRTEEMRAESDTEKSKVLLALFERPPAAPGDTVNSAVVIAAESTASYPGLKTAADYFVPLTEIVQSKGFKPLNDPYEFPVDGWPIVRRDFTKDATGVSMHQSSLVMLAKGYAVSFTFIAANDDDIVELIEKLSFRKKTR